MTPAALFAGARRCGLLSTVRSGGQAPLLNGHTVHSLAHARSAPEAPGARLRTRRLQMALLSTGKDGRHIDTQESPHGPGQQAAPSCRWTTNAPAAGTVRVVGTQVRVFFRLPCVTRKREAPQARKKTRPADSKKRPAAAKEKDTPLHRPLTTTTAGPGQRPPQRRRQRAVRRTIELVELERASPRASARAAAATRHQSVQSLHGGDARRPPIIKAPGPQNARRARRPRASPPDSTQSPRTLKPEVETGGSASNQGASWQRKTLGKTFESPPEPRAHSHLSISPFAASCAFTSDQKPRARIGELSRSDDSSLLFDRNTAPVDAAVAALVL